MWTVMFVNTIFISYVEKFFMPIIEENAGNKQQL